MSEVEALRQQRLLAAIAGRGEVTALRERGARAERGLAAYRANAGALAERALAAACPTVQAMLGEPTFAQLARDLWHAHPPIRGDLGAWGAALPEWIESRLDLADWPWLADSARLDLALHEAARAADAALDAASLARLAEADPATLTLRLMPGLQLLVSAHPIATIHAAHQGGTPEAFAPVRAALAAGQGEAVCIARAGWRTRVHALSPLELVFMQALLDGASLGQALGLAGESFDFAAWLQRAVAQSWLKEVVERADPSWSPPLPRTP